MVSIICPALGAGFNTLADLFQWSRLAETFEAAGDSMEKVNGQRPVDYEGIDAITLRAMMDRYASTTLAVMQDETNQWGQLIREPEDLEKYKKAAEDRASRIANPPSHSLPHNF